MAGRRAPRRRRKNNSSGSNLWMIMAIMVVALVGYAWWNDQLPGMEKTQHVSKIEETTVAETEEPSKKEESITDKLLKKAGLVDERKDKPSSKSTEKVGKPEEKKTEKVTPVKEPERIIPVKPTVKHKGKAKMAIVLDDFGYNNVIVYKYNAMHIPLTYAVLPFKPYSSTVADAGFEAGNQIIVHLPMESESNIAAETNTIRTSMSTDTVRSMANKALSSVPHAIGMNNHQGSKATADPRVVEAVMKVVAKKGMFILDSRTTGASKIPMMAKKYGVPYAVNELFLDNSSSVEDIKARLQQGANIALRDGAVIVIGHDRANTCEALGQMIKPLEAQGIEFVFVSSLLQ